LENSELKSSIDHSFRSAGPSNTLDLLSELQSALSGSGCQFDDGGALERRQSLDSPLAFFDAQQSPNDGANDGHNFDQFDHIFGLDQGPSTSASSSGPVDLRKMEAMVDDPLKKKKMVDISAPVPKLAPPPGQPASNKIQRGTAEATLMASDLLMATTESGQPLWLKEEAQRSVLLEEVDPEEGEALFRQE
jgi:hypothetical protein